MRRWGATMIRQRNEFEVMAGSRLDRDPELTADAPDSIADLLLRARDGDSAAWEEIVRRYSGVVFATVRSFRLQDADVLDAVQMTWLRLAECGHRVQDPERLAGWLATTARRECLHILRQQARHVPTSVDGATEVIVDPSVGPEQHVIDSDIARTLWKLVAELPPLRRPLLLRVLFTENPRSYTEVARSAGMPPGGIGPTRKRALQQLRSRLNKCDLRPEADITDDVDEEPIEGIRTGSYLLDDLLDKSERRLIEKLDPRVTNSRIFVRAAVQLDEPIHAHVETYRFVHTIADSKGTGDAQLDNLLHRADKALRERMA